MFEKLFASEPFGYGHYSKTRRQCMCSHTAFCWLLPHPLPAFHYTFMYLKHWHFTVTVQIWAFPYGCITGCLLRRKWTNSGTICAFPSHTAWCAGKLLECPWIAARINATNCSSRKFPKSILWANTQMIPWGPHFQKCHGFEYIGNFCRWKESPPFEYDFLPLPSCCIPQYSLKCNSWRTGAQEQHERGVRGLQQDGDLVKMLSFASMIFQSFHRSKYPLYSCSHSR